MPVPRGDGKKGWMFAGIAAGAVAVVALVVVLMSTVFHTARAEVTLSEWKSDISGTYQAGGKNQLSYQPVTASDTVTRSVPATGQVKAEDHASGTIIVSNLYSAKPQRLITNTRFQTKDGLIYRVHAPITVPGYTTKNGAKVAGFIEAVVYADEAGDKYNISNGDFTLPGLKGSSQFDLITAKAKGVFSGGFVGMRATVEKSVRDQAIADLKADLDRSIRDKVAAGAPPATIVFTDSIDLTYIEKPDQPDGSNATLAVEGHGVAPAFSADSLARALAEHAQIASDAPLDLKNPTELTYTAGTGGNTESGDAISFTLSGTAHLAAVFNSTKLAVDLAGKTYDEAQGVRSQYPALVGPMTIKVYPFWYQTLPANPERISVVVTGALDQQP